jgi:uncharacterized delta-60 repeat protein
MRRLCPVGLLAILSMPVLASVACGSSSGSAGSGASRGTSSATGGGTSQGTGGGTGGSAASSDAGSDGDAPPPDGGATAGFTVTLSPPALTIGVGYASSTEVSVIRTGGLAGSVTVTVAGLPTGVTAAPLVIDAQSTQGTLTLSASSAALAGDTPATVNATDGALASSAPLSLHVVAPTSGTVDPTFGSQGTAGSFPPGFSAAAIAVQPDGKILLGGDQPDTGTPPVLHFAAVRCTADGVLDPTFGAAGEVTGPAAQAWAMALQPDGKIVLGGRSTDASQTFTMVRLLPNGALDTTFGTQGAVSQTFASWQDGQIRGLAVQPDGKIVAAGSGSETANPTVDDVVLMRLAADGSLDTTFGSNGVASYAGVEAQGADAYGLVLQPDGKLLVTLSEPSFGSFGDAIVRFTASGVLDTTWSSVTFIRVDPIVDPDGTVLTGASAGAALVYRLTSAGAADTTFAQSGQAALQFGGMTSGLGGIVRSSAGAIYVAGWQFAPPQPDLLAVAKLTSAGALDVSFGTGGFTLTTFPGISGDPSWIGLSPDGRVLVWSAAGITRYWP